MESQESIWIILEQLKGCEIIKGDVLILLAQGLNKHCGLARLARAGNPHNGKTRKIPRESRFQSTGKIHGSLDYAGLLRHSQYA
jgi:hypothetical protein